VSGEPFFQSLRPVFPQPPDVEETINILSSKQEALERSLSTEGVQVSITPEAIERAARLADRYYRKILPPAGARALLTRAVTEVKIRQSGMVILHDERVKADAQIDPEDVVLALQKITGIEVSPDDPEKYLRMEETIMQRIIGQDEAVTIVSKAIRRAQAGLKDPKRPIGSFIFMGPSGVGKTELSKALAEFLFEDEQEMTILDMSEYQSRENVARLIGAPPGYIGYEEGGQLTEAVRKKPYSVVVFDEIEKAHPNIWNALLQIMEEGRLTDGQGRVADFRNTVVILTGNVGSDFFFLEDEMGREKIVEAVQGRMEVVFRPEFLNRVDKIIVFNSLKPKDVLKIVDLQTRKLAEKLAEQGLSIELTSNAKEFLAQEGYDPAFGARPLRRAIQDYVETPLAESILKQDFSVGDTVLVDFEENKITLKKKENK
jgi:ATP-dependent Clp protease ATP-binding subunit ClpA